MKQQIFRRISIAICAAYLASAAVAAQQEDSAASSDQSSTAEQAGIEDFIASLRSARDGLLTAQDYQAALNPAEVIVSELEDAGHPELAREQIMLAFIFAELDRFNDAEVTFFEAIENLESQVGGFSPALITPMQLLARTYMRARRFPEAISVLEQAQFISQRNEGLFNVDQTMLIDDMTTAHLGMGDTVAARDLQIERLENAQRRFGSDDPRVIPYHNELADYYARSRLRVQAREQYEAVLEIEEARSGPSDPSLLQPLRQIAEIDLVLGRRQANRERIEEILAERDDVSGVERGLSLALLGDWALAGKDRRDAEEYYAEAFELLSSSEDFDADAYFADPTVISFVPPLSNVDRGLRRLPYAWGTIVVEFNVGRDGRVTEITGIGAEPAEMVERAYVDRLQQAVFRPSIVDGHPVDAEGVRFTHYFRYYVDVEEESDSDDEEE